MDVLEYRSISLDDEYDDYFNDGVSWSRVYEYPLVMNMINKYIGYNKEHLIHNTSWGYKGIHVTFKDFLDNRYDNVIHSDIKRSRLPKTMRMDILRPPPHEFVGHFDVVLNISTMEHIVHDHVKIFKNLLSQVRDGGLLIITFDLPILKLDVFDELFNMEFTTGGVSVTNVNSKVPFPRKGELSCGIMVVRK
jgi:SAM-dependent methyltransferase